MSAGDTTSFLGILTGQKWHRTEVIHGSITIKGGYNRSTEPAKSITYHTGPECLMFIELNRLAHWLVKGGGGKQATQGALKSINVLNMIRDKVGHQCSLRDGEGVDLAVASGSRAAVAAPATDYDPMNELGAIEEESTRL